MKNLTIEITDKCPFYCKHCSTYGSWDREDILMQKEEFIRILENYPEFKDIRLSGGEPFMHPEIIDFKDEIISREREVEILTCGVYRKENTDYSIPEELIKKCRNIKTINFSIHGSEKIHEEVVQRKNIFHFIDESINRVIKARIPFSFGFVPLRTNYKDLEGAVSYIAKKSKKQDYCQPKLFLLRYVKQGSNHYIDDEPKIREELSLSHEENNQILEESKILQAKYKIPIVATCSMLESGCTAGTNKKVITVYGEVCDCSALKWNNFNRENDVKCRNLH